MSKLKLRLKEFTLCTYPAQLIPSPSWICCFDSLTHPFSFAKNWFRLYSSAYCDWSHSSSSPPSMDFSPFPLPPGIFVSSSPPPPPAFDPLPPCCVSNKYTSFNEFSSTKTRKLFLGNAVEFDETVVDCIPFGFLRKWRGRVTDLCSLYSCSRCLHWLQH